MLFLSIALMLGAKVGILNAIVPSTRERYREFASLKAIGLTPRQALGSVIDGSVSMIVISKMISLAVLSIDP
jgi:ABC-type lipoprotein release transport system permease subunit